MEPFKAADAWIAELTCGEDERAERAALQARALGEAAILALGQLAQAPNPEGRWWAARALAETGGAEAVDLLLPLLQDEDLSVRQCAILSLGALADPRAAPPLTEKLEDPDSLSRRLAGDALVAIGEAAVPDLLGAFERAPQAARRESVRALALIADRRAIPALFAALDDPSAWIEHWASEGLERMGVGMVFFKPS